jgi:hypothetical protein
MRLPLLLATFAALVGSVSAQVLVRANFTGPVIQTNPTQIRRVPSLDAISSTISYATGGTTLNIFSRDTVFFRESTSTNVAFSADTDITIGDLRYVTNAQNPSTRSPNTNLVLSLRFSDVGVVTLAPIAFSLTESGAGPSYTSSFGAVSGLQGNLLIGQQKYVYNVTGALLPISVRETGSTSYAPVNVRFHPIPEPSTYGAFAVAGLGGLVIWRRRRAARVTRA